MKNSEKSPKNTKKNGRRPVDIISMVLLAVIVISMAIFTATRNTDSQEIILMEIYKSAGPDTSTAAMNHYYIYSNTNSVGIRNGNTDGSNNISSKEIEQNSIDDFKSALDTYINKNVTINTSFYINERYTIEYNGKTIIVPNPSVAQMLGFDSSEYSFYYTVDNFINLINN